MYPTTQQPARYDRVHIRLIVLLLTTTMLAGVGWIRALQPVAPQIVEVPMPVERPVPVYQVAQVGEQAVWERVVVTAYNSEVAQTDDTPYITASGERVRWGGVAVSRDLLQRYPYGTRLLVVAAGGQGCGSRRLPQVFETVFVVSDTMHPRKTHGCPTGPTR